MRSIILDLKRSKKYAYATQCRYRYSSSAGYRISEMAKHCILYSSQRIFNDRIENYGADIVFISK